MDDSTLEGLLHEGESDSLDYKRDQYPFQGAADADKAELLKDILAFANSWRRVTAYILIGVQEVKGGRSIPVGVADHLKDNDLQQLVNSKTNRPVSFQYIAYPFDKVQLGIIEIPLQDRPLCLTKSFDGLVANAVFVRRGSSTDVADPDEVARMGLATAAAHQVASLALEWGEPNTRRLVGTAAQVQVEVLDPPLSAAAAEPRPVLFDTMAAMREPGYGRKKVTFVFERGIHRPLFVVCHNGGRIPAQNVVITGTIQKSDGIRFAEHPPDPPRESYLDPAHFRIRTPVAKAYPDVDEHADHWTLKLELGTVLPGETRWAARPLYVGADRSTRIDLPLVAMAENIPEPLALPLSVEVTASKRAMERSDLRIRPDEE